MRKVKCPVCEHMKRPYGMPQTTTPRAMQTHRNEYEIGTFKFNCDKCGTTLFVKMDYIIELAPVDIKEVWTADGTPGEVVDEKRGSKKQIAEVERVDESLAPRPSKRK